MSTKSNTSIGAPTPLMMAIAAGSKYVIESLSASALAATGLLATSPVLVGTLFAAGAYCISRLFSDDSDDQIIDSLSKLALKVKVNSEGAVSTTVKQLTEQSAPVLDKPEDTHTSEVVESKDGKTIVYNIHNLHFYLNAEIVHQLNVNPKEVINKLIENNEDRD